MKLPKFVVTALVPAALALGSYAEGALAQVNVDGYPSKPIVIVVPTAGTGIAEDTRIAMAAIQRAYAGTSLVLEPRPGAATTIGTAYVARAKPDGYTLLMVNNSTTITPSVYPNLPYDIIKDFSPITVLVRKPHFLAVHTSVPVKNIKEYIAFAKANPGALNFATPGKGGSLHMPGVLLDYMAKINVTYVHYSRSAQRLTDTVAGFTQVMVGADNLLPHFKSGRLRPLGVTTLKRSPLLPDLPAIAETLPGYDYSGWTGIVAPAKVETALLAKINKIWTEAMRDNISQEKVAAEGASVVANSSQEFAKFIATEVAKWAAVVKATGLTMGNNE